MKKNYSLNDREGNFIVTKSLKIEELQMHLVEMTHEPTKASVLHLANNDEENLFSLSFRTLPKNSRGAAHILEHVVLCGSKKFPVKDPFFSMRKRSLHTFMNAMTGADFTCYPASSQVEKDFYNLLEVYLDAAFFPEIKHLSFLQEGHRLEFAQIQDSSSPLLFKGVVFNEMKGAMNQPDSRLWHEMMLHLLPDLTYSYNSGGDPKEIPLLSYEELLEFHKTYYHPSNALFFFYGNLPLGKHLRFIEKNVLKEMEPRKPLPKIPLQKRFSAPKEICAAYPMEETEDLENKNFLAFGWLTSPLIDQETTLALTLLNSILMDTDASPLKAALQESKLCTEASSVFETDMSEIPYILVCKGCAKKDQKALLDLTLKTLQTLAKEGISDALIQASLHQLEFERLEISGDNSPWGLSLFMRAALFKQHGGNSEDTLTIHTLFKQLKKKLENPNYLPSLIEKYFLQNKHLVSLCLNPDPLLLKKEQEEEKQRVQEIEKKLNAEQKKKIIEESLSLLTYQEEMEKKGVSCLPKIEKKEIPKSVKDYPLQQEKVSHTLLYHHDTFTNEILYSDLIFDLSLLKKEEIALLPLFASFLTEVGTKERSYKQQLEYLHAYTGEVSAYMGLYVQADDPKQFFPGFSLHGKALYRNSDKLLKVLKEILHPNFQEKGRLEQLLLQEHTYLENALNQSAMRYAIHLSLSSFSKPSALLEQWHGMTFFKKVTELVKNKEALHELQDVFASLKEKIFQSQNTHLILSCDKMQKKALQENDFYGLCSLPSFEKSPWTYEEKEAPGLSQGRIIASDVAFTSLGMQTIGYMHEEAPYLLLGAELMANLHLHKEIREKGGAYGSGASYSPSSGQFYFYSYRDPHIKQSVDAFRKSIELIADLKFTEEDLEEAKLGILQSLDKPISPGSRAIVAFDWQRTKKDKTRRASFRKKILGAKREEVALAVKNHLLQKIDRAVLVSFAGKELLQKENKKFSSSGQTILPLFEV